MLYRNTDSFEQDNIGVDLAYLMCAIVSDNVCVWPADEVVLVKLLQKNFGSNHKIWQFVVLN